MDSYDETLTSEEGSVLDDSLSIRSDDPISSSFFDAEADMSNNIATNNPLMKQLSRILDLKDFYKTVERSKSAEAELLKREERKIINSLQKDTCQSGDYVVEKLIGNEVEVLDENNISDCSPESPNFEHSELSPAIQKHVVNHDDVLILKPAVSQTVGLKTTNPIEEFSTIDSKTKVKPVVVRPFLKKGAGLTRYYAKKPQLDEEKLPSEKPKSLTKIEKTVARSNVINSVPVPKNNPKKNAQKVKATNKKIKPSVALPLQPSRPPIQKSALESNDYVDSDEKNIKLQHTEVMGAGSGLSRYSGKESPLDEELSYRKIHSTISQNFGTKREKTSTHSTGVGYFSAEKRHSNEKNFAHGTDKDNQCGSSPKSSYSAEESVLVSDSDDFDEEDTELHLFEVMEIMTGRPSFTEFSSLARKFVNQEIGYEKGNKLDADQSEDWQNCELSYRKIHSTLPHKSLSRSNEDVSIHSSVQTTESLPKLDSAKKLSDSACNIPPRKTLLPYSSLSTIYSETEHDSGSSSHKLSELNVNTSKSEYEIEKSKFLDAIGRLSKLNSELIETKDQLQCENVTLQTEKEQLAAENKRLKDGKEQIIAEKEKLRGEKEKLRKEKEQLSAENKRLKEEKEQIIAEKEKLRVEKEKLRTEKERLIDEKEELIDEKEQLIDDKALLVFEKDQLMAEKKHLIEEKKELIDNINVLTNDKDKLFSNAQDLLKQKNKYYKQCIELKATNSISGTKLSNGDIELRLDNGTTKYISRTGRDYKFVYRNEDIKEMELDGTVKYYYAESKMWHITHPDGVVTIKFPDGQTETQNLDGSKKIVYPNNVTREIKPTGEEQYVYPDKTTCVTDGQGVKCYSFPNGQTEYHYPDCIKRLFPDNTVKTLYPDGSTQTQYMNGRIRIKNKDGIVVQDTGEPPKPEFLREIHKYMMENPNSDSEQSS